MNPCRSAICSGVAAGVTAVFITKFEGGRQCQVRRETKRNSRLWIHPEIRALIEKWYQQDNCRSQSKFIEKAVRLYCSYISVEDGAHYRPAAITSALTGMVDSLESRMARLIFKLAVEMSMMMNILAANADMDQETLRRLRGKCVNDIKGSVGSVTFEDAMRFQKDRQVSIFPVTNHPLIEESKDDILNLYKTYDGGKVKTCI